jgi:broad specificity phosphatase PhoE
MRLRPKTRCAASRGRSRLEGLSYSEIVAHVREGDAWVSAEVHGGESLEAVGDRMFAALNAALETSAAPIIIVSHAFAIVALLKRPGAEALSLENAEMIELDMDEAVSVRQSLHHALKALDARRAGDRMLRVAAYPRRSTFGNVRRVHANRHRSADAKGRTFF